MANDPTQESPYTLADVAELLKYQCEVERFEEQRARFAKPSYSSTSEFMTFQHWLAFNSPVPGRLSEEAALRHGVYRRPLQAARTVWHSEIDPTTFQAIVAEVLDG